MARKSKASVESTEVLSGENAIQNKEIEGLSQGQIVRKRFFRHRAAVVSLVTIISIVVLAFSALDWKLFGVIKVQVGGSGHLRIFQSFALEIAQMTPSDVQQSRFALSF